MCLASNSTLARENLSLRPRLEDGKASLAIKYQELREIQEICWDKQQRLGEWGVRQSCAGLAGMSRECCINRKAGVGSAPSDVRGDMAHS